MKKVNWKKLYKRIPKTFKAGKNTFKVQWVEEFPKDKDQIGESDYNNKVISIIKDRSYKQTVYTYIHEVIHIFSDEFELKISEKQVQGLEKTLHFWLKNGNIFK